MWIKTAAIYKAAVSMKGTNLSVYNSVYHTVNSIYCLMLHWVSAFIIVITGACTYEVRECVLMTK